MAGHGHGLRKSLQKGAQEGQHPPESQASYSWKKGRLNVARSDFHTYTCVSQSHKAMPSAAA